VTGSLPAPRLAESRSPGAPRQPLPASGARSSDLRLPRMHFPLQKSFRYRGSFPRHDRARVVRQSTPSKTSGGRREGRVPAAPAAPVRKKSTGKEPQVKAETSGLPCAMVLRFIRALPGDRACLPGRAQAAHGASRALGASVGAPGPHDFTVRKRLGRRAQRLRPKLSRPSHPASRFVTTANRPSWRSGTGEISHISEKRKRRIFFAAGLDTGISVESALRNSIFRARDFCAWKAHRCSDHRRNLHDGQISYPGAE